jgi:hypothetical protein
MALFFECMLQCARKLLDTADIVREAMLRQLTGSNWGGHCGANTERRKSPLTEMNPSMSFLSKGVF